MILQPLGAVLIVGSSSYCGFAIAARYRMEERQLKQLHLAVTEMQCGLSYQLTPLPELAAAGAKRTTGELNRVLTVFSENLSNQLFPDAQSCMAAAIGQDSELSDRLVSILHLLGISLGRFDLSGQLKGFEEVQADIDREVQTLAQNRENRLRSYCTLGICAGAALAVLLL